MKKILLPVVMLLLALSADAQKVYFRGGLSYAVSHGGAVQAPIFSYGLNNVLPINGSYSGVSSATNTSESFELSRVSYTAGLHGVFAVGAMINNHVGVELAANIGLGTKKMNTEIYSENSSIKTWLDVVQQCDIPVMLTPALVLQTGGKINLYARGGIVIPVQSAIIQEIDYAEQRYNPADSTFVHRTVRITEEFKMRLSPGFSGAMGVKIKTGKQVSVWAEAGILSMSLYYKNSEIVQFDQNGQSVLNQLTPTERVTQFEFKGTATANTNIVPTFQTAFSNFNISAGVSIDM